jgi:hypothetical protein
MKRKLFLFFICFCFITAINAEVKYTLIPESPRRGEPMTIAIDTYATEAFLFIDGRQIARAAIFYVDDLPQAPCFFAAILTIPSTAVAGPAVIKINNPRGQILEIPFQIAQRVFRTETLELNPALTTLVTSTSPRRVAEANRLRDILNTTGNQIYHYGKFVPPIATTRRTSQFGTRRVNVYSDGRRVTSIHMGIDYGAPTGTEVYACGDGKVILASDRELTGNSVIIEHGPGIYSIYYHLDSISAQEGGMVEAGELIGRVGSTGFSTGPHLHWEIRINTENTDPDAFLERPLIDKVTIISRLFNIELPEDLPEDLPNEEGGD